MVASRKLEHPVGLHGGDHACWAYDDGRPFAAVAVEYLHEGVARGERVLFTACGTAAELTDQLAGLPGRDALLDSGQLVVQPIADVYADGGRLDPQAQARVFAEAADAAVADGWTGLRVAGDLTELVRDGAHWEDLRGYEIVVDAMVDAHPLTGLCGYAVSVLPEDRLRPLVALHGIRHCRDGDPGFTVRVRGDVLAVAGEVDFGTAEDLRQLLEGFHQQDGGAVTVDLERLEFLDVGASRVLVRFAERVRATGRPVRFVGVGRSPRRVLELFDVELA